MKVEDLDILRPDPKMIRLGGKDIDVSFIPCAITCEIDSIIQELSTISQEDILSNEGTTKKAFDLSVKLCSTFCEHKYPELDEEWFMNNTDAKQLQKFSAAIRDALVKAYSTGSEDEAKNLKAPKKKV
jgi:hypothetical protein